jgi:hypothetical protein
MSRSAPAHATRDPGRRASAEKRLGRRGRANKDSPPLAKAKRSAREGRPFYQFIARTGYLARGLVYAILGLIALSAAFGTRKNALSLTDALRELLQRPFGAFLISGMVVGMVCFACWRVAQGLLDADNLGTGSREALRRAGYTISSLAYLGIAVVGARVVFELPSLRSSSPQGWAAWVLGWPLGSLALGLIGAAFLVVGATTSVKAYRAPFKRDFDLKSSAAKWLVPIGRAGHAARAIIFLLVGYFLIASAYDSDIHRVKDMAGALNVLQHQQHGMILYTAVAIGLTCFGLFEFIQALFRKIGHRS